MGWRLLGSTADEGEAAGAPTGDETDLPATAGPAQFSPPVAQPVRGAEVGFDTLWIRVRAAGQAEAFRRTTQVEGLVRAIPVRENRSVEEGAALLQIDTTEYALGIAQARANLLATDTDYRQLILFDDEIEDPQVRAERERIARSTSGLDQRQVDLTQAELQLERSRVAAPFGGRVADLLVVEGEYVSAGAQLMTIVDLDPIKVEVRVLEAELGSLSEGRRAEVSFPASPGELFEGAIETINPIVDPETRTGRVTVLLRNRDSRVKPGMYAEVFLDAREADPHDDGDDGPRPPPSRGLWKWRGLQHLGCAGARADRWTPVQHALRPDDHACGLPRPGARQSQAEARRRPVLRR